MKKKYYVVLLVVLMLLVTACGAKASSAVYGEDFLEKAHEAVKDAYGEHYMPSMPIDAAWLEDIYGIPMSAVTEFVAEGPMMSVHVDTFIGLQAKAGEGDKLEQALIAYREDLVTNSLQYPMNMAKVQASRVYRTGDYVFFIMLGKMSESVHDTEEDALAFAKEQVDLGVSAIEELLK